jgi:hypothetical protein
MSTRGNPVGLIKAVRKNPRMSPSTKRKALAKLQRQAERRGLLGKKVRDHWNPRLSGFQTAKHTVVSTITVYGVLSLVGFGASFVPLATAAFALFQLWMLLRDVEGADDRHRLLQNFIASSINISIGWVLKDPWGLVSVAPLFLVIAKVLE